MTKVFVFDLDDTLLLGSNYVDYEDISEHTYLRILLNKFSYPKYIYTNGTLGHAKDALKHMSLNNIFTRIFPRSDYMKPNPRSFNNVNNSILYYNMYNKTTIYFFDDILENLKAAKEFGWKTIWINTRQEPFILKNIEYVDHIYNNIYLALLNINF
jgi:FMN phosphatase YigB (HAD superfamily)